LSDHYGVTVSEDEATFADQAVVVRGVLHPTRVLSWRRHDGMLDQIESLLLVAWRIGDSGVTRERLRMRTVAQISKVQRGLATSLLPAPYERFGVVEIEAHLSSCQTQALLAGNIKTAVDSRLQPIADEFSALFKPPTDFLAEMSRDGHREWHDFETQAVWLDSVIPVNVAADGDWPAEGAMQTASRMWAHQEAVTREIREVLAAQYKTTVQEYEHREDLSDGDIVDLISLDQLAVRTIAIGSEGYRFELQDDGGYSALVARYGDDFSVTFKDIY